MGRKLVESRRVPPLMEVLLDCRKADKQFEDSADLILHGGNSFIVLDSFPC